MDERRTFQIDPKGHLKHGFSLERFGGQSLHLSPNAQHVEEAAAEGGKVLIAENERLSSRAEKRSFPDLATLTLDKSVRPTSKTQTQAGLSMAWSGVVESSCVKYGGESARL
jgi:hypothetical protein